jgi:hypothetical protein
MHYFFQDYAFTSIITSTVAVLCMNPLDLLKSISKYRRAGRSTVFGVHFAIYMLVRDSAGCIVDWVRMPRGMQAAGALLSLVRLLPPSSLHDRI